MERGQALDPNRAAGHVGDPAADRRLGKLAFVEQHVEGEPQMAAAELGIGRAAAPKLSSIALVQDRETLAVERAGARHERGRRRTRGSARSRAE